MPLILAWFTGWGSGGSVTFNIMEMLKRMRKADRIRVLIYWSAWGKMEREMGGGREHHFTAAHQEINWDWQTEQISFSPHTFRRSWFQRWDWKVLGVTSVSEMRISHLIRRPVLQDRGCIWRCWRWVKQRCTQRGQQSVFGSQQGMCRRYSGNTALERGKSHSQVSSHKIIKVPVRKPAWGQQQC